MISLDSVSLGYGNEEVLRDVSISVNKGDFVGVIGLSGAGKSTLLMSLIGNIQIFSGDYQAMGFDLTHIGKRELRQLRSKIGFIFQGYNLVERMSVFHNVMSGMLKDLPLSLSLFKVYQKKYAEKAYEYMKVVGIENLALKRCDELSGGQRQRVAIARALAQEPRIILADEPVAALDPKSAQQIMEVLQRINEKYQVTILTNLHHIDFAKGFCSRIFGVAKGRVCFDGTPEDLTETALEQIYSGLCKEQSTPQIVGLEDAIKKKEGNETSVYSETNSVIYPNEIAA